MPSLSLTQKIFIGFAIIVALLLVNGLVSYSSLNQLQEDLQSVRRIGDVNATVLKIDRDIQELRLRVDRFVVSGHESLRDEVAKIDQRIGSQIKSAQASQSDQELLDMFTRIDSHMKTYMSQFDTVVKERQLREDLVHRQLPKQARLVEQEFGRVSDELSRDSANDSQLLAVKNCGVMFSQADKSFLRYYESPDTRTANVAVDFTHDALDALSSHKDDSKLQEIAKAIEEYERIGLRAVQATRSYLFFRNVVMAGEASEVAYYSRELRNLSDTRRKELLAKVEASRTRLNRTSAITIAFASICSLLIAGRLAFIIVPPIAALTDSFGRLSSGDTVETVPGTERSDEIGKMANAALVFSRQNAKTRELLAQSEALGEELRLKAAQLEETVQELDSFTYVASHDLKSPLRGIRQLATWIEEDSKDLMAENSLEHLQHLKSRVERMEVLLQDLLEYSRVGRLAPKPEPVDLHQCLQNTIELLDNPSNVQVKRPDENLCFDTLSTPFQQVLLNLVSNAVKHNDKGKDGVVRVDWRESDEHYHFVVEDNGPGIAPRDHERAFQMYQRVSDPTVDGSGMGLAIVKKQVEHLGGEIRLESELGQGARFEFSWPKTMSNDQEENES